MRWPKNGRDAGHLNAKMAIIFIFPLSCFVLFVSYFSLWVVLDDFYVLFCLFSRVFFPFLRLKKTKRMNESYHDIQLNKVALAGPAEAELTLDYSDDDLVLINNVKVLVAPPISRLQMNIVAFCTQGRIQFEMNGKPLLFEANQILACPSNFSFSNLMMSPDFEFKALFVSNRMLQGILRARMNSWTNLLYVRKQHVATLGAEELSFLVSFYEMLRTITSSPSETPYKMEVMESLLRGGLIALLGFLLTQAENEENSIQGGRKTSEAIFQQFLDLVGNSEVKHLPVEHFARELCVTPKYLSSVCKNHSGKTANEWIREYVLEDIRYYLLQTNLSIKQICALLGFPNSSFFGRYVKEHFGVTPSQLRKG